MYCQNMALATPNSSCVIYPGNKVKLGRFSSETWLVQFGWYSWGGNRPVCGWYLTRIEPPNEVKPLQLTDLDDIYLVEN